MKQLNNYSTSVKTEFVMSKSTNKFIAVIIVLFLWGNVYAEGTKQMAPTSDDIVMLLIGSNSFGNFASYTSSPNSRLYFSVKDASEVVYFGLGAKFSAFGNVSSSGGYQFRIRRASDNFIVHGPYSVTSFDANITSYEDAVNGPFEVTGQGYQTTDNKYRFEPGLAGDYYIEFQSVSYLGWWDIAIANNGVLQEGRVWSKNWALRTPVVDNDMPECVWDRDFNATLYSYTSDGFVSKIDFNDSGFQGLSFTVAFNETGPRNTGDIGLDRMSVPDENLTGDNAEHKVFINIPDSFIFPDGDCANIDVSPIFHCDNDGYCLPVETTTSGLMQITLDFNGNGVYDPNTLDVQLLSLFEEGNLSQCIPWDGLKGNGEPVAYGDEMDLLFNFQQGVQHWAVFDGEYLKDGFCVEVVRPICDPELETNILYWDDRNITVDPGTGQPKDGRSGCACGGDGCRTWTNFSTNVSDCADINDDLTSGYGDKNTLNTWWLANSVTRRFVGVPVLSAQLFSDGDVCEGEPTVLTLDVASNAQIVTIKWYDENGLLAEGGPILTSLEVLGAGTYTATVLDEFGCTTETTIEVAGVICPADVELDKVVNNQNPEIGARITYSIVLTNENGPGGATGIQVEDIHASGLSEIMDISNGGVLSGNTITWSGISVAVGETVYLTYTALVGYGDYQNIAEITDMNEEDPDSTPGNGVDTDNDGDCEDDAGDEDDGDCLTIVPLPCDINVEVMNLICNNNGTPSIASDDIYSIDLIVDGQSASSSWSSDLGLSGSYDEVLNFSGFEIADGAFTITFFDSVNPDCIAEVEIIPPSTCSNQCELTSEVIEIYCDPSNTMADASDDVFYARIELGGYNLSPLGWTTSDGSHNGAYNTMILVGPYLIADGDVQLDIEDVADGGCQTSIYLEAPASCSDDCFINIQSQEVRCDDAGTPSRPLDDIYYVTLVVDGFNLGSSWSAEGINGSFSYGQEVELGPFSIAENPTMSIPFTDNEDAECTTLLVVNAPETCSPNCEINVLVTDVYCDDAGTPWLATDDVFYVELFASGYNLGANWESSLGHTGAYAEYVEIGPFNISDGSFDINIFDSEDGLCAQTLSIDPPATCSNDCAITAEVLGVNCWDLGEEGNPYDDTFTYEILVTGYNTATNGWTANDGTQGQYGIPAISEPHLVSEGPFQLEIMDLDAAGCVSLVDVSLPIPEITCPDDTDIAIKSQEVQVLHGQLDINDQYFDLSDSLCWMPDFAEGNHYYDRIELRTSPDIDSFAVYTFVLYTDMSTDAQAPLPAMISDGYGAFFAGNYYINNPCVNVQNTSDEPAGIDGLIDTYPFPQMPFASDMNRVMQFTVSVLPDAVYNLITTTWVENSFGNYNWVVIPHNETLPLSVTQSNVNPLTTDTVDVEYRLTFFDIASIENVSESTALTGSPNIENECGIGNIGFTDLVDDLDNCEDYIVHRSFYVEQLFGDTVICSQDIIFHTPEFQNIVFPPLNIFFGCGETYPTDMWGSPLPSVTGFPFILTASGMEVLEEGVHYNMDVGFKDTQEFVGNQLESVIRDWTIRDECNGDTLAEFSQNIIIDLYEDPVMICPTNNHACPIAPDGTMLIPTDPFDCTASAELPLPEFEAGCGVWDIPVALDVYFLNGNDTISIAEIPAGGDRYVEDMVLGDYLIVYTIVEETTGEIFQQDCYFRVVDLSEPVAICKDQLVHSLNGQGNDRIFVENIDDGSYDNCDLDSILIRRLIQWDEATCDSTFTTAYSDWGTYIDLNCCDVGRDVIVQLRVVDVAGNANMCWSRISVVDNTLPFCYGLADTLVSCATIFDGFNAYDPSHLRQAFGWPNVQDNCAAAAIELDPEVNLNNCGEGEIIRSFIAVDQFGNEANEIFQQTVTIGNDGDGYAIVFNADTDFDCENSMYHIYGSACSQFVRDTIDHLRFDQSTNSYYIERQYSIIDQCVYDGISDPVEISRDEDCDQQSGEENVWLIINGNTAYVDADSLYNNDWPAAGISGTSCNGISNTEGNWRSMSNTGYWIYTQHLTLEQSDFPQIHAEPNQGFCTVDTSCSTMIDFIFEVVSNCYTEAFNLFEISIDLDNDGNTDLQLDESSVLSGVYPEYIIQHNLPIGVHTIHIAMMDGLFPSNEIYTFQSMIQVYDCYVPDPQCQSGMVTYLEALSGDVDADNDGDIDEAAVEVFADDLATTLLEDCSAPLRFSVNKPGQVPHPSQSSIFLTCDERYSVELEVYVWDNAFNPYAMQPDSTLGGSNYKYCNTLVYVQDPNGHCEDCASELSIDGKVWTYTDEPVAGVDFQVGGAMPDVLINPTNLEGAYSIAPLQYHGHYSLMPFKDDNPDNGVSVLDLIKVQRHILGSVPFVEPWQMIAADVNGTHSISAMDIIEIQQVALGNQPSFSMGVDWMFIDAAYTFPDQSNPWVETFPEIINIADMTECWEDVNFRAIKIGDVDGTAVLDNSVDQRGDIMPITILDQKLFAGTTFTVDFPASAFTGVAACQMSLSFDPKICQLESIEYGQAVATDFGLAKVEDGIIDFMWLNDEVATEEKVFSLTFTALQHSSLEDVLKIENRRSLSPVAIMRNDEQKSVYLAFNDEQQDEVVLYQNTPNPFDNSTQISFYLPQSSEATITVRDVNGRQVKYINSTFEKGYNSIVVGREDIPHSGLYYYELQTNSISLVKKMILVE